MAIKFQLFVIFLAMSFTVHGDELSKVSFELELSNSPDLTVTLVGTCASCSPEKQILSDPLHVERSTNASRVTVSFSPNGAALLNQNKISQIFVMAHSQTVTDGTAVTSSAPEPTQKEVIEKIALYTKKTKGNFIITPNIPEEMLTKGLLTKEEVSVYSKQLHQQLPAGLMMVARVSGQVNQTVTTSLWVAKSFLPTDKNTKKISLQFPKDFSAPLITSQQVKRPDYQLAIANMREAEKLGCAKTYPKKLFSESYLRTLPDKEVLNLIEQSGALVIKLKNKPITQATLTTLLVDSLCEYRELATLLVKVAIAIVSNIITGGSTWALFKDVAQTGSNVLQEIERVSN